MRNLNSKAIRPEMVMITLVVMAISMYALVVAADSDPPATSTPKPPPFPSGETIRFAVIGDFGNGSAAERRVADLIAGWNPDFVITTGDNNYPDGDASTIDANIGQFYSQFIGNYQGSYGSGSDVNRFWPSLGNHDWHTIDCTGSDCSGAYFDYFTLPGNERFYEVDYGLVHLFAVDSEVLEPEGVQASSPQANWLRDALAASTACFDVVFFHHAPYSSGSHGSSVYMRWPFQEWGAEVVMAGHDHTYERIHASGFPYFVNGAGGKSLYAFTHVGTLPAGVESVLRYNTDYGAMLVTASASGIIYQFYNTSNQLVDELAVPKGCSRKNYLPLLIR